MSTKSIARISMSGKFKFLVRAVRSQLFSNTETKYVHTLNAFKKINAPIHSQIKILFFLSENIRYKNTSQIKHALI